MILAIDPGNIESAYTVIESDLKPVYKGKEDNLSVMDMIAAMNFEYKENPRTCVIEMIACYGMPVGKDVFDTCVWIGRFIEQAERYGYKVEFVYRKDVKINLCGSMKAKDSNIRRALIDRFAKHDFKNGKGTKKEPDWFYGFKADIWQSYAAGITYCDTKREVEA